MSFPDNRSQGLYLRLMRSVHRSERWIARIPTEDGPQWWRLQLPPLSNNVVPITDKTIFLEQITCVYPGLRP
jgi:hypothetical protein